MVLELVSPSDKDDNFKSICIFLLPAYSKGGMGIFESEIWGQGRGGGEAGGVLFFWVFFLSEILFLQRAKLHPYRSQM